jgi:purine-binding chemotaxis protein CheW
MRDVSEMAASVLILSVGETQLALPLTEVAEILPMPSLSLSAALSPILDGTFLLGGRTTPVIDLAALLDLAASADSGAHRLHDHLILPRASEDLAGGALRVRRVLRVAEGYVKPSDSESFNGCVSGEFLCGAEVVPLLSLARLLTGLERARIAGFAAMSSRRLDLLPESPVH